MESEEQLIKNYIMKILSCWKPHILDSLNSEY